MKKTVFALVLFFCMNFNVYATEPSVSCNSAILIERATGTVLFEKNPDLQLPMASVTKTMTLLLTAEKIDKKKIGFDDIVTVSDNASSMTGSRVYLSENEKISVSDLLKSIAVSSGNDAAVAISEFIAGSEENFVDMMNQKAQSLGLENTHFVNCYGLDADGHYSSARDLAVISDELLKYDFIRPYLTIWMDSIRDGTFTLSNTNKLVRFYEGCTGIKTGFTSKAMYCLSASALRDDMELIAVVLGGHNSKVRFADASGILNFGFENFDIINIGNEKECLGKLKISKGKKSSVSYGVGSCTEILVQKNNNNEITSEIQLVDNLKAPVRKGQKIGTVTYYLDGNECKTTDIVSLENVEAMGLFDYFNKLILNWLFI